MTGPISVIKPAAAVKVFLIENQNGIIYGIKKLEKLFMRTSSVWGVYKLHIITMPPGRGA